MASETKDRSFEIAKQNRSSKMMDASAPFNHQEIIKLTSIT